MQNKTVNHLWTGFRILIGSLLYAVGFQFFLYPNDIVPGGVTGIAMILNYLTSLPVGAVVVLMNVPLFIFSWKKFGMRFIVASILGTALSSAAVDLLAVLQIEITHEPLLAAVYGGIIKGAGLGVIYRAGATTGGSDLIAKYLRHKYQYLNFGTLLLALDAAVIAAFALIFQKFDSAMYAVICMFIAARVIDLVLYGAVNSKVCYIITDESAKVKDAIWQNLHRGVTFLHGEGAWSGTEKNVILCVIKPQQIVELRKQVEAIDEKAFLIVSDAREVFGKGFADIGDEDR